MPISGAPIRRSSRRETARRRHAADACGSAHRARDVSRAADRQRTDARVRRGRAPAQRGRRAAQSSPPPSIRRRHRAHAAREGGAHARPRRGAVPRAVRARDAVRARASGSRPRRHGRRRDRGRRPRARAPGARRDDRAAARSSSRSTSTPAGSTARAPTTRPTRARTATTSWAGPRRTRTPRTGWPRCIPTTRRLRGVHGAADGQPERQRRVPPVRGRRRDALDARALQEPAAAGWGHRGHRHRHGHLLEPGGRRGARGQRGQARARAQGGRRLRLRPRAPGRRRLADGQIEPQPREVHGRHARSTATPRATSGSTCIHPDDRDRRVAPGRGLRATARQFEASYRLVGYDGVERWVLDRNVPYDGGDGRKLRLGLVLDVSDRRQLERQLQSSVDQLRGANAELRQLRIQAEQQARTDVVTGAHNRLALSEHVSLALEAGMTAASCCSTSTTSSRSTTRSATAPATACSSRSPGACASAVAAATTAWRAGEARSSPCCCATSATSASSPAAPRSCSEPSTAARSSSMASA